MSDNPTSEENTKPCAYCGSMMSATATLCPVCKSYQSVWRTAVVYVAGIAGLIGLIGSAIAYIIGELPTIHKVIAWQDRVQLWDFRSVINSLDDFNIAISNIGDGPVILSSIIVYYGRNGSVVYTIQKSLASQQSLVATINTHAAPNTSLADYDIFLATPSGRPNDTITGHASMLASERPCLLMIPFLKNSPDISRMEEHYTAEHAHLVTVEERAVLDYFSIHDSKDIIFPFATVSAFAISTRPECRALNYSD